MIKTKSVESEIKQLIQNMVHSYQENKQKKIGSRVYRRRAASIYSNFENGFGLIKLTAEIFIKKFS